MYQNHSDISLLELKHQYFTGWLFVERLKGWKGLLCFAVLLYFHAVLWKWKTHFSVCLPVLVIFQFYSTALIPGSVWCITCSLPFCLFLPLPIGFSSHSLPLPFFPLSLWISYIHTSGWTVKKKKNRLRFIYYGAYSTLYVYVCLSYIVSVLCLNIL